MASAIGHITQKGGQMDQEGGQVDPRPPAQDPEEVPFLQRLYDSPFILLFLGFVIMLVLFTGWGLWEVMSLPTATLP
jgi:hypothetical protein